MLKELLKEKLKTVKPKKMGETFDEPKKEYYPHLNLSSDDLKEIKDWKIGKDYYLVIKVEQTNKNMRAEGKDEKWSADFDIKQIGVASKDDVVEDEEKDDKDDIKSKLKSKYA